MNRAIVCALLALPLAGAELPQVLWRAPGNLTNENWTCGPGGCDQTPQPPFKFLKEDRGGTQPKLDVRDANGRTWSVKFGAEVIPECFGSRFVTAVGYSAEPTYFVGSGKIEHCSKLRKAARVVKPDGAFEKARFEIRDEKRFEFLKGKAWSWQDNPFSGTHELAGLKIMMMLLSNWDAKDAREGDESNNNVFRVTTSAGRQELWYTVYDWGASLGRWGSVLRRDQSDCSAFAMDSPRFVRRVRENEIEFGFVGKHSDDLKNGITRDDVRWLLPYLQRIKPEHVRTGLRASGATERQATCWSEAIEQRIQQLEAVIR